MTIITFCWLYNKPSQPSVRRISTSAAWNSYGRGCTARRYKSLILGVCKIKYANLHSGCKAFELNGDGEKAIADGSRVLGPGRARSAAISYVVVVKTDVCFQQQKAVQTGRPHFCSSLT